MRMSRTQTQWDLEEGSELMVMAVAAEGEDGGGGGDSGGILGGGDGSCDGHGDGDGGGEGGSAVGDRGKQH